MRRLATLLLTALLPLAASTGWHESFELGGELLYWKAMTNEPRIAILFTPEKRDSVGVKPDNDWGFRIDVGYECECFFGTGRYLWLETLSGVDIRPGGAMLSVPGLDFDLWELARPDLRFHYQNADVRMGQYIHKSGRSCSFAFVNFRYADVVRRLRVTASNDEESADYVMKSELDGSGLGIGMGGSIAIWRQIRFRGEINVMGLIADRKFSTWRIRDPDDGSTLLNVRPMTCAVPAVDFRLDLSGSFCIGYLVFWAEVGYEINQIWQALRYADPVETLTDSPKRCHDVGFGGPYLKLSLSF